MKRIVATIVALTSGTVSAISLWGAFEGVSEKLAYLTNNTINSVEQSNALYSILGVILFHAVMTSLLFVPCYISMKYPLHKKSAVIKHEILDQDRK